MVLRQWYVFIKQRVQVTLTETSRQDASLVSYYVSAWQTWRVWPGSYVKEELAGQLRGLLSADNSQLSYPSVSASAAESCFEHISLCPCSPPLMTEMGRDIKASPVISTQCGPPLTGLTCQSFQLGWPTLVGLASKSLFFLCPMQLCPPLSPSQVLIPNPSQHLFWGPAYNKQPLSSDQTILWPHKVNVSKLFVII